MPRSANLDPTSCCRQTATARRALRTARQSGEARAEAGRSSSTVSSSWFPFNPSWAFNGWRSNGSPPPPPTPDSWLAPDGRGLHQRRGELHLGADGRPLQPGPACLQRRRRMHLDQPELHQRQVSGDPELSRPDLRALDRRGAFLSREPVQHRQRDLHHLVRERLHEQLRDSRHRKSLRERGRSRGRGVRAVTAAVGSWGPSRDSSIRRGDGLSDQSGGDPDDLGCAGTPRSSYSVIRKARRSFSSAFVNSAAFPCGVGPRFSTTALNGNRVSTYNFSPLTPNPAVPVLKSGN